MARPVQRNAFRAGEDELRADPSYASSGESKWSRDRARSPLSFRFRKPGDRPQRPPAILIEEQEEMLAALLRKCQTGAIARQVEIKRKFIAKLKARLS